MKTIPNNADKTVINAKAAIAPPNTVRRGYFYNNNVDNNLISFEGMLEVNAIAF
jgi:hypothetical protein